MRAVSGLGIALVAALALWLFWPAGSSTSLTGSLDSEGASSEASSAAVDGVDTNAEAAVAPRDADAAERTEDLAASEDGRSCGGRVVVGPEQEALAGVTVRFTAGELVLETVANQQGEFGFVVPEFEFEQVFAVVAVLGSASDDPAHANLRSSGPGGLFPESGDGPSDLLIEAYRMDHTISGTVTDLSGAAIEGASVVCFGETYLTDADGRYSALTFSRFDSAQLFVRAPGYAQQERFLELFEDATVGIDFTLTSSLTLAGVVQDEQGSPIDGAAIEIAGVQQYSVDSNGQGEYFIDHIDSQRSNVALKTVADGFASQWEFAYLEGQGENKHDIILQKGVRVHGHVVDEQGQGIAGVRIFLGEGPSHWKKLETRSVEEGAFEFARVRVEPYWLNVNAEGYPPFRVRLDLSEQLAAEPLRLELSKGRQLDVLVVDEAGEPIERAWVNASVQAGRIQPLLTNEDGLVQFSGLPEIGVKISAHGPGYDRVGVQVADGSTEQVEVQLEPQGVIAIQVLDAATREPVSDFWIRGMQVVRQNGERQATISFEANRVQSEDGIWSHQTGKVGQPTALRVSAEGYADYDLTRFVLTSLKNSSPMHVLMQSGHRVYGRVLTDGKPVAGARIRCETEDGHRAIPNTSEWDGARTESTADGSYEMKGLQAGQTYIARVTLDGWQTLVTELELTNGGTSTQHDFELVRGATVHGVVRDAAGQPISNAKVTLFSYTRHPPGLRIPDPAKGLTTDDEGRFEITGVGDGDYELTFQHFEDRVGIRVAGRQVSVIDGQDVELNIQPSGSASIVGEVQGQTTFPTVVWVQLSPARSFSKLPPELAHLLRQAVRLDGGRFKFTGVDPGVYQLEASFADATTGARLGGRMQVEVAEDQTAEIVLPVQ